MSEFLSETEGCDLLARLFKARGYAIQRNMLFREYGVEFHVDGWDPKARVGFEFLTSEDDDHVDLTLDEYQTLSTLQQKGELSLFIIDEVEPLSAADLTAQAHEFLDEVADAARARRSGRAVTKPRAAAQRVAAARKPAVAKVGGKKAAAKVARRVAKKPAGRKPGKKAAAKKAAAAKPAGRSVKKAVKKKAGGRK